MAYKVLSGKEARGSWEVGRRGVGMSWVCSMRAPLKQEMDTQGHGAHCQSLDFLNEANVLRFFFFFFCNHLFLLLFPTPPGIFSYLKNGGIPCHTEGC